MSSRIPTHKSTPGVDTAATLSPYDPAIQQAKQQFASHGSLLDVSAPTTASQAEDDHTPETQTLLPQGGSHNMGSQPTHQQQAQHHEHGPASEQEQQERQAATHVISVGGKANQGHLQSGDPDVAGAADIDD